MEVKIFDSMKGLVKKKKDFTEENESKNPFVKSRIDIWGLC